MLTCLWPGECGVLGGRDVSSLPGPEPGPGPWSPGCASPPPSPTHPHSPPNQHCPAPGCLRTWALCPDHSLQGPRAGFRTGRDRGEDKGLAQAACEREQEAEPPPPAQFTAGGNAPPSAQACGGEAQTTWPQGAKPSKIHLLRVRADNTCPLPTSRGLGVLPPGGALPSPGVQHTSGVLTTPGSLTLGALNPGPRASWPRPSSWSHRGAGVGAGLGDWWPLVRSSGVEWGPHLHRTNANS